MNITRCRWITLAFALLAGCSSNDPPPEPPKKNVFDSLTSTEQRARDVQTTLDESAARQRKAVDAEEHGDKAP